MQNQSKHIHPQLEASQKEAAFLKERVTTLSERVEHGTRGDAQRDAWRWEQRATELETQLRAAEQARKEAELQAETVTERCPTPWHWGWDCRGVLISIPISGPSQSTYAIK